MSESGSLVTSGSSQLTGLSAGQAPAGNGVALVPATGHSNAPPRKKPLPKLPSHRFRYTIWHELSSTNVTGDQLKAPRVRDGPEVKDKFFYKVRDDSCRRIHHSRRGAERKDYQISTERWETAKEANLSYQELHTKYQRDNFERILQRLHQVEHLQLIQNEAVDLSSVTFPSCRHLNLTTNYINTLKNLPKIPKIEELILTDNYIQDLNGLNKLSSTPLQSLYLRGNPVSFTLNYRQRVFAALPHLKTLDGIARLPQDDIFEEETDNEPSRCVIS